MDAAIGEWGGWVPRWMQVAKFRQLADRNSVFGFNKKLKRDAYAFTPIIDALHACDDEGAVSVAMVPPAMGKTTASYCFMQNNKETVRGIAFCQHHEDPYVSGMLRHLGLNKSNPPDGWLSCLIDALDEPVPGDNRKSYLILDEFYSRELVLMLKTHLRGTRVRLILLTPSKDFADSLLHMNDLEGIVPLNGTYRGEFPAGEWVSMCWSAETMKFAAREYFSDASPGRTDEAVDEYLRSLPEDKRSVSFLKVVKAIRKSRGTLKGVDKKASISFDDPGWVGCPIIWI